MTEMKLAKPDKKIDIDRYGKFGIKERSAMIRELESDMYGGTNEDGADIIVLVEKGIIMEVLTFQENGWLRSDEYDARGLHLIETFQGRWR